jgi:hypothetical protein
LPKDRDTATTRSAALSPAGNSVMTGSLKTGISGGGTSHPRPEVTPSEWNWLEEDRVQDDTGKETVRDIYQRKWRDRGPGRVRVPIPAQEPGRRRDRRKSLAREILRQRGLPLTTGRWKSGL